MVDSIARDNTAMLPVIWPAPQCPLPRLKTPRDEQTLPTTVYMENFVSSLEHALPAPELLWDWWSDSTRSPFETAKTVLFFYVFATQTVRIFRHLRARGLRRSVADGYVWTSKVPPTRTRFTA